MGDAKIFYNISILLVGELEAGINPDFQFDTFDEATEFIKTCFENGYAVEFSAIDVE